MSETIIEPISEGEISFTEFDEGGEFYLTTNENDPIKVDWSVWPPSGDFKYKYSCVIWDFGLYDTFSVEKSDNFLIGGYNGLSENSSYEEIIKSVLLFDVMHAFGHDQNDPNYVHLHWALRGWLSNRLVWNER